MSINNKKVRTGVKNLHIALLKKDTTNEIIYEEPIKVTGLIRLETNPETSRQTLRSNGRTPTVLTSINSYNVTLEKDSLPNDLLELLLGYRKHNGSTYTTAHGAAPYFALMYEQTYSNGTSSYVKLFKGKFSEPETLNETSNDTVSFQPDIIYGNFVSTNYEKVFDENDFPEPLLKQSIDEEDETYTNEGTTWFESVL